MLDTGCFELIDCSEPRRPHVLRRCGDAMGWGGGSRLSCDSGGLVEAGSAYAAPKQKHKRFPFIPPNSVWSVH